MAIRRLDSLGYQIALLNRLYDRRLQEALGNLGVAPGQFAPLVMLFEKDGLTQAELCRRINVEQPTMANTLDRMERDDLVRRQPDPADRRRATVHLTQRALEMRDAIMGRARKIASQAVDKFTIAEQEQFFNMLARMTENMRDR